VYRIIIKVLFIEILIEQVKEQRKFIWSLKRMKKCVWRKASEELRLKQRVWRRAPENTSSEARSLEAKVLQKHISSEATSPELTKDNVRIVRPRTLQPPSLHSLSPHQDKDNSNLAAVVVPFIMEWILN